jgi:hypothetical protein
MDIHARIVIAKIYAPPGQYSANAIEQQGGLAHAEDVEADAVLTVAERSTSALQGLEVAARAAEERRRNHCWGMILSF